MPIRKKTLPFLLSAALLVAGCNITTPSQIKTGDIRLVEDMKTASVSLEGVNKGTVSDIAEDYRENGDSRGLRLVVPYVAGKPLTEMDAKEKVADYKKAFADEGVRDITVDYVAVEDSAHAKRAVVAYRAVSAVPPENCRRISGYEGAETDREVDDYPMGCETKTILTKMISNPKDLLGKDGVPDSDARRQGRMIENNMNAVPNEPLEGESASQIGGGGG